MQSFRTLFWILIASTVALAVLAFVFARAVAATFQELS